MRTAAHIGGCCRTPLDGSAFGETGRLAAPGGRLRFRVPPVPDHHPPGSIEKINVVRFPQDSEIILHSPFRRQIARLKIKTRLDEIMVRTKSRRMCREKAGASERRPYQGGATDLHPPLSSPSATPLRSGGYAARLSELTERRRAQKLRRKTRLVAR